MKLYLIEFNNHYYDQYDGFVVAAENKEDAIKVIQKRGVNNGYI